jgi:hypothetical protein
MRYRAFFASIAETSAPRVIPAAGISCIPSRIVLLCLGVVSLDSYRQTLCRLSHTLSRYRPFRLSTLDCLRRAKNFKSVWLELAHY